MSQAAQDSFCKYEYCEFSQLKQLLSTFNYIDYVANVKKMMHRYCKRLIQVTLLRGSILENCLHNSGDRKDPIKLMLIWDTVASYGLTLFRSNFIYFFEYDIPVKDVTKINRVIGIGATLHKFINSNGKEGFLPCVSYQLIQTDVQLFSPHT